MKNSILILISLAFFPFKNQAQTVTDIDGNVYNTVTIGTQVWMKENLKVTRYKNGDEIPNIEDNAAWTGLSTGAYCNYQNDDDFVDTYGRLYNWFAVDDSREICPTGWHIATDAEWTILSDYLGGRNIAGGKLKEVGTVHWTSPNTGATNSSGFTGLPSGIRSSVDGVFGYQTEGCGFWSNTQVNATEAWDRYLVFADAALDRYNQNKNTAYSVRCLKDNSTNINLFDYKPFKAFPNPATDKISICFNENIRADISIYNFLGRVVLKSENFDFENEIDVSSLKQGIYIIELSNANIKYQQKIVIE